MKELEKRPVLVTFGGGTGRGVMETYSIEKKWVVKKSLDAGSGADFQLRYGDLDDAVSNPEAYGIDKSELPEDAEKLVEKIRTMSGRMLERRLTKISMRIQGKEFLEIMKDLLGKVQEESSKCEEKIGSPTRIVYSCSLAGGTGGGAAKNVCSLIKYLDSNYEFLLLTSTVIIPDALPDVSLKTKIVNNMIEALEEMDREDEVRYSGIEEAIKERSPDLILNIVNAKSLNDLKEKMAQLR